jgi:hypothetical protein
MAIPTFFPLKCGEFGDFFPRNSLYRSRSLFFSSPSREISSQKKTTLVWLQYAKVDTCPTRYLLPRIQPGTYPSQTPLQSQARALQRSSERERVFLLFFRSQFALPINLSLSTGTLHALLHSPSHNLLSPLESCLARNSVFEVFFSIDHSPLTHLLHSS